MQTRFKMVCNKKEVTESGPVNLEFNAVFSDDPESENKKFWEYTPAADFVTTVDNVSSVEHIEVGKEYYFDVIEAPAG